MDNISEITEQPTRDDLIQEIEQILEMAKSGELIGIVWAGIKRNSTTGGMAGTKNGLELFHLLGALRMAEFNLTHNISDMAE